MLRRIRTRKEENELWEVEVALFLTLENTIQPTTNHTVCPRKNGPGKLPKNMMLCIETLQTRFPHLTILLPHWEKVNFRSQILERPSIGEYWNISGVPVLSEKVIFTFFRKCWCYSEAYNTGMQKWSSIVQYSCTSIWDFKYTFSPHC